MSSTLDDLTTQIELWAKEAGCSSDPFIGQFAQAVKSKDQMGAWASIDPFANLPTPSTRTGTIVSRLASSVSFLRNLGVFVPVAVTWASIAVAAQEFGTLTTTLQEQNPDRQIEVNFFRFWQESDKWWRLSHVAILDVIIIGSVILLSILAQLLRANADWRIQTRVNKLEQQRRLLAIQMKLALHGRRDATVESVTESIADSLNDLTQAARDLGVVAGRFEEASIGVSALSPQIEKLNSLVSELLARGVSDVSQAVGTLMNSVKGLDGTVAGGLKETLETAVAGITSINDQMQVTGASVEFGTKQLRDDLDALHERLSALLTAVEGSQQSNGRY